MTTFRQLGVCVFRVFFFFFFGLGVKLARNRIRHYTYTNNNIYIYIYKSKHTRQRLAVATQSFTPVGDLQATDISNLLHAYINKADI